MKLTAKQMVEEAQEQIKSIDSQEALQYLKDENTVFVDIRDGRELKETGTIPNAFHCPRGVLEFWLDSESPYYKENFHPEKRFIFYCAIGWRSSLATLTAQNMGLKNVYNLKEGINDWITQELPIEKK